MILKLKRNFGMSVNIAVIDTEQKQNRIKLFNRKIKNSKLSKKKLNKD